MTVCDKRTSLLRYGIIYGRKKFCSWRSQEVKKKGFQFSSEFIHFFSVEITNIYIIIGQPCLSDLEKGSEAVFLVVCEPSMNEL